MIIADVMDLRAEVLDFLGRSGPDRSTIDEPDDISPFAQSTEFGLTAELLILLRRQLDVQMMFLVIARLSHALLLCYLTSKINLNTISMYSIPH